MRFLPITLSGSISTILALFITHEASGSASQCGRVSAGLNLNWNALFLLDRLFVCAEERSDAQIVVSNLNLVSAIPI